MEVDVSAQTDESRIGRRETTRLVELAQVRVVVHMDPLHTTIASDRDGPLDQRSTNATSAEVGADRRFEEERMDAAIPCQPDKADELVADVGTDKS